MFADIMAHVRRDGAGWGRQGSGAPPPPASPSPTCWGRVFSLRSRILQRHSACLKSILISRHSKGRKHVRRAGPCCPCHLCTTLSPATASWLLQACSSKVPTSVCWCIFKLCYIIDVILSLTHQKHWQTGAGVLIHIFCCNYILCLSKMVDFLIAQCIPPKAPDRRFDAVITWWPFFSNPLNWNLATWQSISLNN